MTWLAISAMTIIAAINTIAVAAAETKEGEHPDFIDYMSYLQKSESDRAAEEKMMHEHEEWLQTTWGGWAVRTLIYVGKNPFMYAVLDSIHNRNEANTVGAILFKNAVRLCIILAVILIVYSLGKIMQMIIGEEIIVEEHVILIDDTKKKGQPQQQTGDDDGASEIRRSARDKKKKVN